MIVSIVINVLCSYEIVRRQIEHFRKMNLPDTVEIIFVDDGSNPPLSFPDCKLQNFTIYYTNDKRPWTQGLARNLGAQNAKGSYLLMTDIDHILSKEAIMATLEYTGDKMMFPRLYGILDENGDLQSDLPTLLDFGLNVERTKGRRGMCAGHHGNTFAMKKTIFEELGGYQERHCIGMMHQGRNKGEDCYFYSAYTRSGRYKPILSGPAIYFFPTGRFQKDGNPNPHGLFHTLSSDPVIQPMIE